MTGFPDSMWRSPARLIHPDHHCSHSHEHGSRDRHRGSRSKQADVTDVRPSTHHQHHHSPCPLHLRHRLVVPRLKGRRDFTTHQGPVTCQDVEGVGSGPSPHLREGPALEPGMLTWHHHLRSRPDPSFMTDVRMWTAWCLGCHSCPDVRSSCPRSHNNKLRREPSQWSLCLPDQQMMARQVTARQVTTRQVTAQQMMAQHMTGRQVTGPADSSALADPAGVTGPTDCVRLSSCCWPSTVSGPSRFRLSTPIASNLQLLRRDALLKNFGFQPQVFSTMRTAPFEGLHVLGPEPKVLQSTVRTIRQADRMVGSSVTFAQRHRDSKSSAKATSSKKSTSRTSVFDRLGSPTATATQRTVIQEPPFRAGAVRGALHRSYSDSSKKSGKFSAASSTRQRGRVPGGGSPGRLCPALAESAGQLLGHRHCRGRGGQCIPATTSAHPSVHQLPDQKQLSGPPASRWCLAAEGSHRADHQCDIPRVPQPVVPGPKEDRRSTACNQSLLSQPPHGSSTLQDGDARVCPFSHQKSGVDDIDRHPRCLPSCSDAPGQTACPDDHQCAPVSRLDHQLREVRPRSKSGLFQFIGMQFNTWQFTVAPPPKMRRKVQSVHQHWITDPNITARDLHRLLGMLEVTLFTDASRSGWGAQLGLDTGTVFSISKMVAHQRSGDAGHHQHCERLPASSEVPGGLLDVRQRSDCGLHQEWGGHEIAHFDAADHMTVEVVRPQGDYVGSCPSARSAQHPGGFPVQSQPDTDHGVDDGHGASSTRVCHVGRAAGRLVCDIGQQTTHQVRIAVSGPQGRVDRCHVHALGQREGPPVRVPTIQDGPSSSAEDRSVTRSQGDFDRSTATGSVVVSGVDGSVPRRSDPAVCGGSRPADSRRLDRRRGDRDSSLPAVKSTCVETLRAILRAKGHSREAANMMSRCLRESSLQVYESHWSRFVAFCRTKRWHVFRVRSHHFSTYMMHLFKDGLLPSMMISHRTYVASVLPHWVYDPAADPHIKLLVRAFRLERPVQRRIMPKWNLHLVLLSLLKPPFASDGDEDGESSDDVIPLKRWTLKCVFLLVLASARRRSYLHALSIAPGRCVFARGNTQWQLVVSLMPKPGFLAKNQLPTQAPEWITVPGIAHLNPTERERMLCPVRQLKLYIQDSERILGGRQCMFIHWNCNIRDIMRSHISRWIVETVKEAYA